LLVGKLFRCDSRAAPFFQREFWTSACPILNPQTTHQFQLGVSGCGPLRLRLGYVTTSPTNGLSWFSRNLRTQESLSKSLLGRTIYQVWDVFWGNVFEEMWGMYCIILYNLGGGFKYFLFSSIHLLFVEMIQFDEHIFQMDWFNHQLVVCFVPGSRPNQSIISDTWMFWQLDDPMTPLSLLLFLQ